MICMDRIGKITTEDNGDGTRSMRTVANRKLLVTFRYGGFRGNMFRVFFHHFFGKSVMRLSDNLSVMKIAGELDGQC